MILLPRHFFRYILRNILAVCGQDSYRKILSESGRDGAITFCKRFAVIHQCTPLEAVQGYFEEMSIRGWGKFSILALDSEKGLMELQLECSALLEEDDLPSGHVIWANAALGVMLYLQASANLSCAPQIETNWEEHVSGCRISVRPRARRSENVSANH